jgi:hypothetical protein
MAIFNHSHVNEIINLGQTKEIEQIFSKKKKKNIQTNNKIQRMFIS